MQNQTPLIKIEPAVSPVSLPQPSGYALGATSVGNRGEILRLFVKDEMSKSIFATEAAGIGIFPVSQTPGEYSVLLEITDSSGSYPSNLNRVTATFPQVQLLQNEETLVVSPRCRRFSDGKHEMNGRVYDKNGNLIREFLLGDGIESVQTDREGRIWVSYFDEGVIGNYGWSRPIGNAGLVCFSAEGEKLWEFDPPSGFDRITDCHALNVAKDGVWAYYYTKFPVARIDSDWRVKCWPTSVAGARALAVRSMQVLLFGGYPPQVNACRLVELSDHKASTIAEISLILPDEVDLSKAIVVGRDMNLHVIFKDEWYKFSLESLK